MAAEVMRHGATECPDLETIAAYLDGRVAEGGRGAIAEHLATCETCYFVFSEAAQIQAAVTPAARAPVWWKNPRMVWPVAAAGLAAAAAIVLALSGTLLPSRNSEAPQLTALIAAVGNERTIEPRLTGGFAHAPLRGAVRSGTGGMMTPSPDLRIAAAVIEKQAASQRSPEALRARGLASLVTGDVNRAVSALEEAAAARPDDAQMLSDLAAAYLVRADRNNHADDVAKALASVNRALNADRSLPEALFNRAYALERLSLTQEARDAWQAYLTIDDRTGWAEEARTHLRALDTEHPRS